MRRSLSIRIILVILVLAGAVYVALAAGLIARRVLPAAGALHAYSEDVLLEHSAIRASLDSLDVAIGRLRRHMDSAAPRDSLSIAEARAIGAAVRARLGRVAGVQASARMQSIPADMRLELASAVGAEQAAAATVLEAIAALELDRRADAVLRLAEADSLRTLTRRHLDEAQGLAIRDVVTRERSLLAAADDTFETLGYWALIGALLIAAGAFVVHRRLYRPLAELERSLLRVAGGDLAAHVDVHRPDELGRMGEHFNRMTAVLRERAVDERQRREDLTASFGEILEDSDGEILLFEEGSLTIVRSTRGARRALGHTGEELRARTPLDLWTGFDRPALELALAPLRSGEIRSLRFTTRQTRKDGTSYPVEVTLHHSSVAQPSVYVAFVHDLTGRELNDQLREFVLDKGRIIGGGDLARALSELCSAATAMLGVERAGVWRFDGERIVCIEQFERTQGRRSAGVVLSAADHPGYFRALAEGRPIPADDARADPRTMDLTDLYLDPSDIVSMLDVPVRVAGRLVGVICLEAVGETRRWTTQETACVASLADLVAIAIEASERLRTQEALRASEARYRAAFEQAGVGIAEVDLEGRVLRANEAFRRMLQHADEDLTGRSSLDLMHADDRVDYMDMLRRLATGEAPVEQREQRWLTASGASVWTSATSAPVLTADGRTDHIISVFEDITERRSLQAQLTHVQKMESIGRLAGGMAHDFNNLLTAILGYVDLARDQAPAASPLADDLGEIERAARRGAQMTRQLLTFARRQVVEPAAVDLNELARAVARLVRPLLGERIELSLELNPVDAIMADAGQLENVLVNLIVNARDAMPSGGRISIRTRPVSLDAEWAGGHPHMAPGRHISLTVTDTGSGMDAATLSRIFEPFFTTKEAGKGTGLGLATCYGIVRQAGGDIEAVSEPGRGTEMRIYLPVAGRPHAPAPAAVRTPGEAHGRGRVVLLVDDEPQIRSLMVRTFLRLGFEVLEAGSAEEAEEIARRFGRPLDLLVTDMVLPGRGGRDFAQDLAADQPGLPVLYVSGYTQTQLEHDALIAEGAAFLPKPFTVTELADRVGELLGGVPRNAGA